jgi:hypothetical protein
VNPTFAGSYETPGGVQGIFVAGDYIYLADSRSLMILHFDPGTGIEEIISLPDQFSLGQNHPNPFNAATIINYSLPEATNVTIEIYDILGRRIETLIQEKQPAGVHTITFDASSLSSGVYFYRLQAGNDIETKRMVLLK